jgi:hypothetical protein
MHREVCMSRRHGFLVASLSERRGQTHLRPRQLRRPRPVPDGTLAPILQCHPAIGCPLFGGFAVALSRRQRPSHETLRNPLE